jgi:hypothetical protein
VLGDAWQAVELAVAFERDPGRVRLCTEKRREFKYNESFGRKSLKRIAEKETKKF